MICDHFPRIANGIGTLFVTSNFYRMCCKSAPEPLVKYISENVLLCLMLGSGRKITLPWPIFGIAMESKRVLWKIGPRWLELKDSFKQRDNAPKNEGKCS